MGLSDLYLSPEALADIMAWGAADIDDFTKAQIFGTCNCKICGASATAPHTISNANGESRFLCEGCYKLLWD
jgi:formylmethanofuran dehydrogenase subunit E